MIIHPRIPPTARAFRAVRLPDTARPPPVAPVQVPYVPDFWDSAKPTPSPAPEPGRPKLHVVGGSATHYDGGPTHNLEKPQEDVQADQLPASQQARLWPGLGLPTSFSRLAAQPEPAQSRPLTAGERSGLYVLLGIIAGSWLVGGLVNQPAVVAEETN